MRMLSRSIRRSVALVLSGAALVGGLALAPAAHASASAAPSVACSHGCNMQH